MAFKSRKKFEYKARDADAVRARATASGNREGFLAEGVKTFTPKVGTHTIRILPPTWDEAEHYGYDLFAHYNVGVDGGAYLCLEKHKKGDCAICAERQRATRDDDEDLEAALKPRQRVACWVIDRDNERDGPLLWMMPWSLDREMVQQAIDKKSGEVYNLDDPDEGYDVSFERTGEGVTTKYVGVQLERKSSPLSDDDEQMEEWLNFVSENPVPDQLVFQDEQYLVDLVGDGLTAPKNARGKDKDKKDDKRSSGKRGGDDDKPSRRGRDDDDRSSRSSSRSKKKDEINVEDLDWAAVHEMDEDDLNALAEQEDIDIDDAKDLEDAADMVCEALKIENEEERKTTSKKDEKPARPSMGNRLAALRNKNKK